MEGARRKRLRFGPFEADLESGELFQSGKKIPVQAKPFSLLAALLQRPGEVVTRKALSSLLWPDTHVQADQGLNAAVRKVRRALRDDAENPRYIETLGSRGYRFIHPLEELHDVAKEELAADAIDEHDPDDYLRGRYFLDLGTATAVKKALSYFAAVTERDPSFAPAYCGLADAHVSEGLSELVYPKRAWELARASAMRANELAPDMSDCYVPLAVTQLCLDHDFKGAERNMERALSLNPKSSYAYFWSSFFYGVQGDFATGTAMAQRALRLDPVSLPMNTALCFACYFAGDYDLAVRTAERALELNESFAFAYETLGLVYEAKGRLEDAIKNLETAAVLSGRSPAILGYLGYTYATAGNVAGAEALLRELRELPNYTPAYEVAAIELGLGGDESCIRNLMRAYDDRSHRVLLLKIDKRFRSLESREEFARLTSRIFS